MKPQLTSGARVCLVFSSGHKLELRVTESGDEWISGKLARGDEAFVRWRDVGSVFMLGDGAR